MMQPLDDALPDSGRVHSGVPEAEKRRTTGAYALKSCSTLPTITSPLGAAATPEGRSVSAGCPCVTLHWICTWATAADESTTHASEPNPKHFTTGVLPERSPTRLA